MVEKGLYTLLQKEGMDPVPQQRRALSQYQALLADWNQRINLVSRSLAGNIYEELFYDSLVPALKREMGTSGKCVDIGTGAGIPGIILSIFMPGLKMALVESVRKKVLFLKQAVQLLDLTDAEVIHRRAEDLTGAYEVVLFKAFKDITSCIKLGGSLLAEKGKIIIYKGPEIKAELEQAKAFFPCYFYKITQYILPGSNKKRNLVIITRE